MIDVIIVNLNCLEHTQNLVEDLRRQTNTKFNLIILDQNSIEDGTTEWLHEVRSDPLHPIVIRHNRNIPLNSIWNSYVTLSVSPYVCLLNNDIRIPSNFLHDVENIFESEPSVGAIMHPTNHSDYDHTLPDTTYDILEPGMYRQGWDICVRKTAWTKIPNTLTFYCGDDFVFQNIYDNELDVAMAVSSPIIHYLGQTRQSKFNTVMPERNPKQDIANYKAMGYDHGLTAPEEYTVVHFTESKIDNIRECNGN